MEYWSYFNAWCLTKAIRPLDMAVADMCDMVTFWLFENLSDDAAKDLEMRLTTPPANISAALLEDDVLWSAESEMAMFNNLGR